MSGGRFDHKQFIIDDIADRIERLISFYGHCDNPYNPETIEKFRQAVITLRIASEMVNSIDWLVSDDTCEDTFNDSWNEDIANIEKQFYGEYYNG